MSDSRSLVWRWVRRIAVTVVGLAVLLVGIFMIVGPGPAIVVIPAGLAILATEYVWARRALDRLKQGAVNLKNKVQGKPQASNT